MKFCFALQLWVGQHQQKTQIYIAILHKYIAILHK